MQDLKTPLEPPVSFEASEASEEDSLDLKQLVEDLWIADRCKKSPVPFIHSSPQGHLLPSREAVFEAMDGLLGVMFPGYFGRSEISFQTLPFYLGSQLDRIAQIFHEQIRRGLCFSCEHKEISEHHGSCDSCSGRALHLSNRFMKRLPSVRRLLCTDVWAAYKGDPAAMSTDEVIFSYPGLLAITYQRLAHELYRLKIPLIPRMITERAHSLTGIDIHPGAQIAEGLFIDHGTGIVVGETSTIGRNVRLYQGVTLGARSFPLDEHGNPIKGQKRHPNLEDDVIVYSGATILGDITIGQGSVIGGNVWLTQSVPPHSRVTQSISKTETFEAGGGI